MEHRSDSSHSGLEDAYIGCRVREARAEHGMTQEELAGHVGVEHKHISQITAMIIRNNFRRIELVQLPSKVLRFLFIWHLNYFSRGKDYEKCWGLGMAQNGRGWQTAVRREVGIMLGFRILSECCCGDDRYGDVACSGISAGSGFQTDT